MVLIERNLTRFNAKRYVVRQIPLPHGMFEDAEMSQWIAESIAEEDSDFVPEYVQIGHGMYMAYSPHALKHDESGANTVASALILMHDIRKGPRTEHWDSAQIFGDVMILNRNSHSWAELTPLQLSKLEDWLGAGWFAGNDYNEVVDRDGNIHIGARWICYNDDCFWDSTVESIFEAVVAHARGESRILCRTYPEGPEGILYEGECGEMSFLESGCSWDFDDHIMMADDFCESFVEGMRRFALCDPIPDAGDGYTKSFQEYINDSIKRYNEAKKLVMSQSLG